MKDPAIEARRLLSWLSITEAPISLQAICDYMCIDVRFSVSTDIDALYVRASNGKSFIFINDTRSVERKRFSLAHELGHCVLGHGPISFQGEIRSGRAKWQEVHANIFAGEILMPKVLVCRLGAPTVAIVAETFHVSKEAARIRLEALGMSENVQ